MNETPGQEVCTAIRNRNLVGLGLEHGWLFFPRLPVGAVLRCSPLLLLLTDLKMRKSIFLFAAVLVTAFGIYACQPDSTQPTVPLPAVDENTTASNRADYSSCDECYENCIDCCLNFENLGTGVSVIAFVNPATGNVVTRKVPAGQDTVVCAAGGYLAILGGASTTGKITVCSTGQTKTKPTGVNYWTGTLSWDCIIN